MSKLIDSMWFNTDQGHFGIILAEDETTGELKLYAGVVAGFDQQADERAILSWGHKVNIGMLAGLLARTGIPKERYQWTMNCVLFGAELFKQLSQGQLKKEDAIVKIKSLSSALTDEDPPYLLQRIQDLVER